MDSFTLLSCTRLLNCGCCTCLQTSSNLTESDKGLRREGGVLTSSVKVSTQTPSIIGSAAFTLSRNFWSTERSTDVSAYIKTGRRANRLRPHFNLQCTNLQRLLQSFRIVRVMLHWVQVISSLIASLIEAIISRCLIKNCGQVPCWGNQLCAQSWKYSSGQWWQLVTAMHHHHAWLTVTRSSV